jgi:hypothetical protein
MKKISTLVISLLCSVLVQAHNKPAFQAILALHYNTRPSRPILEYDINRSSELVFQVDRELFSNSLNSVLKDALPSRLDTLAKLKNALKDTNEVKKDTPIPDSVKQHIEETNVKTNVVPADSNYKKILVQDSTAHVYNEYRGLLNDDPIYNKRAPLWQPIVKTEVQNALVNLVDHYIIGYDWAVVGFNSWDRTAIKSGFPWNNGWKWDNDRFGNNFFLHPYTGGGYFNSARANGYNFWESSVFVFGGAYTYKLFGENGWPNGKPERNDLIATTLGGMFAGEVLYRISSVVIDERTTGAERFGREILALVVSPGRAFTRFMDGKMFNHTTQEVYQKEPTDVVLSAGGVLVNDKNALGTGPTGFLLNADFDYGKPFEKRYRKPYDYFQLRADMNFGLGRKWVDNVVGYGILTGKNAKVGNTDILAGIFQHYDYWDNSLFELGTMSFGGGIITMTPLARGTNLYMDFHLAAIPFAGNSTQVITDTSEGRDYNFSGGAQVKYALTLNVGGLFSVTLLSYYYWMHTYVGPTGDNFIGIVKPRIEVHLFSNVGIGLEHTIIYEDRYLLHIPSYHKVNTEQRLFFTYYLADFAHNR